MGIKDRFSQAIDALRGKGAPVIQNTTYDSSLGIKGSELYSWMTGGLSSSGVVVSEKSAMSVSAVYACVGLIGGAIAALPFHIYKRTKDGRERYESDLWWLFNESPAPAWTSASAWQFTAQSILLKGDSFWRIVRASRLSPLIVGFEPLHPDSVVVERGDNSRNVYTVTADGVSTAYEQDDILHFPGLGFDGLRSMTPIRYSLRNAAGIAIAADEHASKFFRGGARPDHALVLPENLKLSAEQKEAIRASWNNQRHLYGEGNTPVLSGGMKIEQLSLNAEDAQLLETRQFGVEEIARAFGVPPHMIGKTDASTSWGSGIEQMSIGFVRYTLRRHIDAIQQEINRKVWPKSLRVFGEFNTDALLDGDSKSQADYFTKALGGPGTQGWMTINEVRKLKNLPPLPEGDQLVMSGATNEPVSTPSSPE